MESLSNVLYSTINEIGKEKIQTDITFDVGMSRQYIKMIIERCNKVLDLTNEGNMGCLSEAILHFMLTTRTLPSVRKVSIGNINLDVVIPNLHILRNFPERSIIIQIIKDSQRITDQLKDIATIQPNDSNIWIVTKGSASGGYINYSVESEVNRSSTFQRRNFSDIVVDINTFLERKNDRSFRFFH